MKFATTIIASISVLSIFTISEAKFVPGKNESSQVESTNSTANISDSSSPSNYTMKETALHLNQLMSAINKMIENESSQAESTISATNITESSSPPNYTMMDTALYLNDIMTTINNYANISLHPQHPLTSGVNLKKAAYAQVNNTEITNFRQLVRYVLNSRAAPVIKNVLTNLDRDLFKLFTPTEPPKSTAGENAVILLHEYPTEKPSTSAAPSTTTNKNGIRNLEEGDDDDEENNDLGKFSKFSSSSYKISMRVKKTTSKPIIADEDDEDESGVFNKLKYL